MLQAHRTRRAKASSAGAAVAEIPETPPTRDGTWRQGPGRTLPPGAIWAKGRERRWLLHAEGLLYGADGKEQHERRRHGPHQRVHFLRAALEGADEDVGDEAGAQAVGD